MIPLRAVAKQTDQRGMLAFDDLHDATFGAAIGTATLDASQHAIAVHGIA